MGFEAVDFEAVDFEAVGLEAVGLEVVGLELDGLGLDLDDLDRVDADLEAVASLLGTMVVVVGRAEVLVAVVVSRTRSGVVALKVAARHTLATSTQVLQPGVCSARKSVIVVPEGT